MIKIFPLFLSLLAGMSTLFGYLFLLINFHNQEKIINFSLSFSSGIMLSLSFLHLIPESFQLLNTNFYRKIMILSVSYLLGHFLFQLLRKNRNQNNLLRLGILSTISMVLHNIPEGMITYITTNQNMKIGIRIFLAILIHNIPEGIAIMIPIYYATRKKKKAFFYALLAALSEPLGAIICGLFLEQIISNLWLSMIFIFTAAIMINISTKELLKEAKIYKDEKLTITSFLFGVGIIILTRNI